MRDDALLAWVESAGYVRESEASEFKARDIDSADLDVGSHSCDALDEAVDALLGAAIL
jgi:hypothetical protein